VAAVIVTIICIAMIVMGGIVLSQGVLTSADTAALSIEDISLREGDLSRTALEAVRAAELSWSDLLRVTSLNTGQTRLASFDRWDLIVDYTDGGGLRHSRRLAYTDNPPAANQWQVARIGLDGPLEYFEPDILNPEEELVVLARLDPLPDTNTAAEVTIATLNGVGASISFDIPEGTRLVPHAENTTIAASQYYQLEEAAPADSGGTVMSAEFAENELGLKILCNEGQPSREARHIFPLIGIDEIPSANWTVHYHCRTLGVGEFPSKDGDVHFQVDVLIRQADGGIRDTIASGAAGASFPAASQGEWITISGTLQFPEYSVLDENDYLEVVYYGRVQLQGPKDGPGYMQVAVDDGSLPLTEQTRIES
jgi:hypothetical protein